MEWYTSWVSQHSLLSAAVQFAVLGTLGEILAIQLKQRKLSLNWSPFRLLAKTIAWALLGVFVKYGFVGIKAALNGLLAAGYLPAALGSGIAWAVAVSVTINLFFGPQLMLFHRIEDNLIDRSWDFTGIQKAWKTLIWFWIPAHSITFALPVNYQIGLAAVWGFVLGLILGSAKPVRPPG